MKDYLNNIEEKELVVICTAKNLTEHFSKGNLITKAELADLRRGTSFMVKAIDHLLKRLDQKYVDKFLRLARSSKVTVLTDSELEVLQKRKDAELKAAYEDSKEYFDLVEITMDLNCQNCTKCFKECDLYRHFDAQEIIPFDETEDLGNCKFSYKI
ncbi:MAG: hypothetical protein K0R54_2091 [Clostridiaceae bacterium]|jgi:soluble cytochrome b562|nr:hypothetical protein [Clostridiaceae bacterium]